MVSMTLAEYEKLRAENNNLKNEIVKLKETKDMLESRLSRLLGDIPMLRAFDLSNVKASSPKVEIGESSRTCEYIVHISYTLPMETLRL
jgi:hypothetical protein